MTITLDAQAVNSKNWDPPRSQIHDKSVHCAVIRPSCGQFLRDGEGMLVCEVLTDITSRLAYDLANLACSFPEK
jgi:hypothetical protein